MSSGKTMLALVLIVAMIIVALMVIGAATAPPPKSAAQIEAEAKDAARAKAKLAAKESEDRCAGTHLAYIVAKDFVTKRLKAPKTAEFPPYREISVQYIGNCKHVVTGFVDAQNSFGALIRTNYRAEVQNQKGTQNWEALSVKLLD